MIDTHIHLVPNVDDGAKSIEMALQMAKLALSDGVHSIIVTPHYNIPEYNNAKVKENYEKLVEHLRNEKLDLKLYLGNEIHLNEEGVVGIDTQEAFSLANSDYYLIELPFHQYFPVHDELIFQIAAKGHKIILAHIERYIAFKKEPGILKALIKHGCYGQLTSSYITRDRTNKRAMQLIEDGVVHIVASDAHNISGRKPNLLEGYQQVANRFGEVVANRLFKENPNRIILNQPLKAIEIESKKNRWYQFFNK